MHAIFISLIAAVYIGFAVADGRPKVIAVEVATVFVFVLIAAMAVTATALAPRARLRRPWVQGLLAGAQPVRHEHEMVATFCAAVDWLVALVLLAEIVAGVNLFQSP